MIIPTFIIGVILIAVLPKVTHEKAA